MNAAPKQPARPNPRVAGADFAEEFSAEFGPAADARLAAAELDIAPLSPGAAALLTLLTRLVGARAAVEVGTGTGVSGLALLAGLAGDGVLTSIDTEPEHQQAARSAFDAAGVATRRARLIAGPALGVLPKLTDGAYDVVFADGDPLEAVEYVEQASRLLRPGGLLVVNHALVGGRIADPLNEDDDVVIMREVLDAVSTMDQFSGVLVAAGDGLLIADRTAV